MAEDALRSTVAGEAKHPTMDRLEDQIGWYDRKSQTAQRRYKILKLAQVIIAGLIPLVAVFPIPEPQSKWVTAILGLLVLIIEAVQQLNQDQQNWLAYRSTCEALKHEKYLASGVRRAVRGCREQRKAVRLARRPHRGAHFAGARQVGLGAGIGDGAEQRHRKPPGRGRPETRLNLTAFANSRGGRDSSAAK